MNGAGHPLKRILPTGSTSTAFALSADVVKPDADSTNLKRIPLNGALFAVLAFVAIAGGTDDTLNVRIYAEYEMVDSTGAATGEVMRFLAGSLTCTCGTNTGASGGAAVLSTEKIVDTLVWTPSDWLTAAESALNEGASGVHSPADNTQACLFLPCLGRAHNLLVEFDSTDADTTVMNVLCGLSRI